jgi:hypothetical protein
MALIVDWDGLLGCCMFIGLSWMRSQGLNKAPHQLYALIHGSADET